MLRDLVPEDNMEGLTIMFVSVNTECKHKTIIEGTEFLPKCAGMCMQFLKIL